MVTPAADQHFPTLKAALMDDKPADERPKLEGPTLPGAPPGFTRVALSGLTREQIEYLISIGAIVRRVPEGNA